YMYVKKYSVRGEGQKATYEHATSWSLHPEEVASLVVPCFVNFQDKNGSQERYWGRNPFKLNSEYAGIVVLALAVFSFALFRKQKVFLFWVLMAIGALVYALGASTPFFYLFYYLIPGVKIFRAPSMIMFWFAFSLIMLMIMGLDRLIKEWEKWPAKDINKIKKRVKIAIIVTLSSAFIVTIGQGAVLGIWKALFVPSSLTLEKKLLNKSINDLQYSELENFIFKCTGEYKGRPTGQSPLMEQNYKNFIRGTWIAAILITLTLGALYFFLIKNITVSQLIYFLIIASLADLWYMNSNFIQTINKEEIFSKDNVISDLENRAKKDIFRVFELPGTYPANRLGVWGIQSIMGFHDNEIRWYREFKGGPSCENFMFRLKDGDYFNNPFLNLLNVKYIIGRQRGKGPVAFMENRGCMPRVFLLDKYEVIDSALITQRLMEQNFDYKNIVLLEKEPPDFIKASPFDSIDSAKLGSVKIMEYNPNTYVINAQMARPGLLIVSDNYFPAWQAFVDGSQSEIYRAYGTLRAVPLKQGSHKIEFKYSSKYINIGKKATLFSFLILLILGGICGYKVVKKS
ncbi:MAG: YfhO family protein, partial [Elusimicrobiota bacterium]